MDYCGGEGLVCWEFRSDSFNPHVIYVLIFESTSRDTIKVVTKEDGVELMDTMLGSNRIIS